MSKKLKQVLLIVLFLSIVIPTFFVIKNSVSGKQTETIAIIISVCFTFTVSILIVIANTHIINLFHKSKNIINQTVKRISLELLITSFSASIIMFAMLMIMHNLNKYIPHEPYVVNEVIFNNISIAVIVNIVMLISMEGAFFFKKWKESIIQAEKFKRENAEAQFAALKNQVNPHFLFNSLNTLSSLISTDQEKAVEFVNIFSKVYRYVLDVKDNIVVSVNDEMNFVNSYLYLQQLRYGDNLKVNIKIDATILNFSIPPMSVQMLLENAIKHNEISTAFPLKITIDNDDKYIVVKNNLQKIETKDTSLGIGISNLKERYNMITDIPAEFYVRNNEYIAKIPVLKEE